MRKSIGYGAYGDSFTGSSPVRLVQAEATIKSKGDIEQEKTYSFQAGATPLMLLVSIAGGGALMYGVYHYFLK